MAIETKVTLTRAPQASVGVTLSSGREVVSTVKSRGQVSLIEVPQKVSVGVSRSIPEVKIPTVRRVVVNTQSVGEVSVNVRFGGASAAVPGVGTVTSVSVSTANGVSGSVANPTSTPAITLDLGDITPTSVAATGNVTGANLSGTNTGDQTDITGNAATATLAANVTTNANLTGPVTSVGNATSIANGAISNAMLANSAVANLSGTNTGDQTNISGNAATVTTNANLTGDVTSVGNAATIANDAVTNAKSANMSQSTIKGRAVGAGTGDPTDLTATQATAILDALVGDSGAGGTKGLAPAPAAGDAAASKFLKADGTWATPATGTMAYINLRDEKAQNTAGGTFTSGAWRTRDLNTEASDTGGNCSLASNQITLAAGTYRCRIIAPALAVSRHQARLFNVTDTALVLLGSSNVSGTSDSTVTYSVIEGRFTIAASKALEVQHQCQTTKATNGFGSETDFTTEVYTIAVFEKE